MMAILMLPGEIGKKDLGKDGCGGRVRLVIRRPCSLVKPQKSQAWPLVSRA